MRTVITPENPHGYDRYGFAWEHIPECSSVHLDFGCYHGVFLNSLNRKSVRRSVGVDISGDAVEKAKILFPELEVIHILRTTPLPFDDNMFTSITVLDVLEHVDEQDALIDELYRVLKDNGVLILTVPGRHFFSFVDLGNFKFVFPRLHRWYYCRNHSVAEYDYRYVSNPDGLVGDISTKKRWHQHFSQEELNKLLSKSGFTEVVFDGTGFFVRAISCFDLLLRRFGVFRALFDKIKRLDAKFFSSCNLFCVASKPNSIEAK